MEDHKWELSQLTTPSGKLVYHCPVCGLYSPAPVKPEYENHPCIPGLYTRWWTVEDGKVYHDFPLLGDMMKAQREEDE